MKFKSITMENFMRYKGVNTIEFSCDPGKNVTVVLGDNTVGKTTIAQAFRFGLYGAVNMEKWKNADDYQLLNNDVLAFMDADSKAAVSVTKAVYDLPENNLQQKLSTDDMQGISEKSIHEDSRSSSTGCGDRSR